MRALSAISCAALLALIGLGVSAQVPVGAVIPYIPDGTITAAKLVWQDITVTPVVTNTSAPGIVARNSDATARTAGVDLGWSDARQWYFGTGLPSNTNTCVSMTEYTDGVYQGVRQQWCKGGRTLIGTTTDDGSTTVQVTGTLSTSSTAAVGRLRVASVTAPSSASDTGTAGDVRWDASYVYICIATNTWKRAAIATWP